MREISIDPNSISELTTNEVWEIYSIIIFELKKRGAIRTKNITGERGEQLAIDFYNKSKGLPKLQVTPKSTKNIDAISTQGERYTIKTIMNGNRTTGVFYGITDEINQIPKFEYLLIVELDSSYNLQRLIEIPWQIFLKFKKWHSRMTAYNISLTKELIEESKILYPNSN